MTSETASGGIVMRRFVFMQRSQGRHDIEIRSLLLRRGCRQEAVDALFVEIYAGS